MKYELDETEFVNMAKKTQFGKQYSDDSLYTLYQYYVDEQNAGNCDTITHINDIFLEWDEYTNTKDIAEDYDIETEYGHDDPMYDTEVQLHCHDEGMEMIWVHDDLILLRTVV